MYHFDEACPQWHVRDAVDISAQEVIREVRGLVDQFEFRIRRQPVVEMALQMYNKFIQVFLAVVLGLSRFTLQQQHPGYCK